MRGLFSIIICSLMFFAGCNYNVIKDPNAFGSPQNQQSLPVNESALVDWNLMKTSVLSSCMSCHVGHTAPELGSLGAVQQNLSKVLTEVSGNAMPPGKNGYSPLSDCRKAILEAWVQQGAPASTQIKVGDLAACKGGAPNEGGQNTPIEQMPLNYQTLVTKILQPKCLKCHNPDGEDVEAAGILFYPFSEITKRAALWSAPAQSAKIVRVLARDDDERMPPPEDGAPLSAQEIDFIKRWIDAGKPQN